MRLAYVSGLLLFALSGLGGCDSNGSPCAANGSCPEGFFCYPDNKCYQPGHAPTCTPQCFPPMGLCDPTSRSCVGCLSDRDCPDGKLCVGKTCKDAGLACKAVMS